MDPTQRSLLDRNRQAYQTLVSRIREQADQFISAQWTGMESWHDADITRFENRILPVVLASQRQVAQLTNAELAASRNIALGTNRPAPPLDTTEVTGAAIRNGVEPSELYRRPQMTLNYELSRGANVTAAVTAGLNRLRAITAMDLQLAKTHTVAKQGRAPYFRRVLSGAENCALCVIASTQRYRRGSLAPMHSGCDCGIAEVYGPDPGQVLDRVSLESVHAAIEAEFGQTDRTARYLDGRNARSDFLDLIVTREHGELGPVLAWREHHFRGPAQVTN